MSTQQEPQKPQDKQVEKVDESRIEEQEKVKKTKVEKVDKPKVEEFEQVPEDKSDKSKVEQPKKKRGYHRQDYQRDYRQDYQKDYQRDYKKEDKKFERSDKKFDKSRIERSDKHEKEYQIDQSQFVITLKDLYFKRNGITFDDYNDRNMKIEVFIDCRKKLAKAVESLDKKIKYLEDKHEKFERSEREY